MEYKTLFVDWDGTLTNSRFWERWAGTEEYKLIQDALFQSKEGELILKDWMVGQKNYHDIINYIHAITGISTKTLAEELQYSAEHMEYINNDDVAKVQLLRKRGLAVLIATDNMDIFRKWTTPALNLLSNFDGILTSDSLGARKHDVASDGSSAFFTTYLMQNNLQHQDAVLIDNSPQLKIVEDFGIDFMHVTKQQPLSFYLDRILNTSEQFNDS